MNFETEFLFVTHGGHGRFVDIPDAWNVIDNQQIFVESQGKIITVLDAQKYFHIQEHGTQAIIFSWMRYTSS